MLCQLRRDIHDSVAESKESLSRQRFRVKFSKKISQVIARADERHRELKRLNALPDEEMPASDVLRACVVLGVIGQVPSSSVIDARSGVGAGAPSPSSLVNSRR